MGLLPPPTYDGRGFHQPHHLLQAAHFRMVLGKHLLLVVQVAPPLQGKENMMPGSENTWVPREIPRTFPESPVLWSELSEALSITLLIRCGKTCRGTKDCNVCLCHSVGLCVGFL